MKLFNVRAGFATNSSSSHSIVMIPRGMYIHNDEYNRFQYGWEKFTLSTKDSKAAYFATQLYHSMSDFESEMAIDLINSLLGSNYSSSSFEDGYVDHQSNWHAFNEVRDYSSDSEYIRGLFAFILRDDVVILGGNDNDEPQELDGSFSNEVTKNIVDGNWTKIRQDGDNWVLFNSHSGTKIRFNIDENAPEYTKSVVPELVDVKVTDFCRFGCQFCFVEGTLISILNGVAPIESLNIGDLVIGYDIEKDEIEPLQIVETYKRDYDGIIVDFLLEDGSVMSLTPEHEVYICGIGWVNAELCGENDDILDIRTR